MGLVHCVEEGMREGGMEEGGGGKVEKEVLRWLEAAGVDDSRHYLRRELHRMTNTHQVCTISMLCVSKTACFHGELLP